MKKIFFLALCLLPLCGMAQRTFVQNIGADYSGKTVTFRVYWNAGTRDATHLSKVWVFVDVQPVTNFMKGAWEPAVITAAATNGSGSIVSGSLNGRGLHLQGDHTAFSSTVTVTLDTDYESFNWCAFATDYPPNVATLSGTTNTIKGSPSFVVNNVVQSGNTFNGTVTSLTDATGCPGCIGRDVAVNANVPCCSNLTAIGGYCRNAALDAASTYSGCGVEIKIANTPYNRVSGGALGCPAGWRAATIAELECIYNNSALSAECNFCKGAPGAFVDYITEQSAGTRGWYETSGCCTNCGAFYVFACDDWNCLPNCAGAYAGRVSVVCWEQLRDYGPYSAKCVR